MKKKSFDNPRFKMMAGVAIAGLVVLALLDAALVNRYQAQSATGRDLAAQQFKQNIEDFFSVRFGALLALKSFYESSEAIATQEFQTFSSGILKEIPDYRALAFVDNNFFIREVYPVRGNEALLGLSLKEPPAVYEPFSRAIREARLTISTAVNFRNGGIGLMVNLPVFRSGHLFGVVLGIFDFNSIVEKSVSQESRNRYHFRLLDPQGRIIYVGPGSFPASYSETYVHIGDSQWKLLFTYKNSSIAGLRLARQILWLLGLTILLSLVTFLTVLARKNEILEKVNGQLKLANEKIRGFEARKQELILERMSDGVMVVDADLHITLINPAALRFMEKAGYPEVRVGERIASYMGAFDVSMPLEKILYSRDAVGFELSLKEADSVVFSGIATALTDTEDNRQGTVLTLRNSSGRRRLERLKTEFIGQISHKLNTPLAVIQESLMFLHDGLWGSLNEKQVSLTTRGIAKSKVLAGLIQRLLDFSDLENRTLKMNLRKETCYVEDFIRQAIEDISDEIQDKKISLERALMSGLTLHGGDKSRLKQMMVQVLENAVRFSPVEGSVRIGTYLANGQVLIEVSDAGSGIALDDMPLIFDPFFQVDKHFSGNSRGAGLGLTIARHIAKAHDGDILVQSEEGKGSTFKISLPYR